MCLDHTDGLNEQQQCPTQQGKLLPRPLLSGPSASLHFRHHLPSLPLYQIQKCGILTVENPTGS